MKVRVGSLLPGEEFKTCLTNRTGVVVPTPSDYKGIEVLLEDGEKVLHRDVVVNVVRRVH